MDPASDSILPLLLVNIVCAVFALGVGVIAGWWCFGSKRPSTPDVEVPNEYEIALEKRLANERAMMASQRLKDMATGVAADVSDHSQVVKAITTSLKAAESAGAEAQKNQVAAALTQLVAANDELQQRLEKAEEQIKSQAREIETHECEARTDSLTQLANRRAFDDEVSRRFAEWKRKATPFSMLIMDVDHFKKFNDTHGHQAGDEVLRQVAKTLKTSCREIDIPCRYGGEEFAYILPATAARDAVGLVERVRKDIEHLTVPFEGKTLNVTASLGLAQINVDDDESRLLKRADDALYAAKEAGRNRSYLHDGEKCVPLAGQEAAATPPPPEPAPEKVATRILDSLSNRTRFSEELRRRVAEAHRTGGDLSLIAVDLIGYNELRAEYGEAIGRLTLDSVAQFLQVSLREMDLLGRLEDGRFVMMLPGNDRDAAGLVGKRASKALSKCSVPLGDDELKLEAQMCIACLKANDSAATMLARAEEGLGSDSGRLAPAAAV